MSGPRYCIGIDLGTTHSALSFIDIGASDGEATVQGVLPVPQLTAHADELPRGELTLPWRNEGSDIVGELARSCGAATPIRLVSSAKSWLSHPGVDRRGVAPGTAARDRAGGTGRPTTAPTRTSMATTRAVTGRSG